MALAPGTQFTPYLLLLLLNCTLSAPTGAHSLCYNFSSRWGWCEIEGQLDLVDFLHYDYGRNKTTSMGSLGGEVDGTEEWRDQTETLRYVAEEFQKLLPDIQLENYTIRAPLTLQAKVCCQRERNKRTGAFWQFGFDGHVFLTFNSEDKKWTEEHPGSRLIKQQWEKNGALRALLIKTSKGDCHRWSEKFEGPWEKILEPTEVAMTPATTQPSVAITLSPWALLLTLSCSILLGFQGCVL